VNGKFYCKFDHTTYAYVIRSRHCMAHRLEPSFEINNGMVVNSLKIVEILFACRVACI
jgi:hypothetical protein